MGRCGLRSRIENWRNFEEKGWAGWPAYFTAASKPGSDFTGGNRGNGENERRESLRSPFSPFTPVKIHRFEIVAAFDEFDRLAPRHSHTVVPLAPREAGRIGRPRDLEADVG